MFWKIGLGGSKQNDIQHTLQIMNTLLDQPIHVTIPITSHLIQFKTRRTYHINNLEKQDQQKQQGFLVKQKKANEIEIVKRCHGCNGKRHNVF
jgi:uncharacterized protein Smg (DUF494 family)